MSGFFRHIELPAADVARYPDLIRRLRREELEGILVTGVYDDASCALIRGRLEAGRHGLIRTPFPAPFRSFFLGMNLNLTPPDLTAYFTAAPLFRDRLARLFSDTENLEARVIGVLAALDQGRHYCAAPGFPGGPSHMFTTLRCHMPGGFIPPHFDNEQSDRDSYRLIRAEAISDLYSFVLAFSRAEAGGALQIFNLRHGGRRFRMVDGEKDASHLDLTGVESVTFRLGAGDMMLFNSGRYLHRVTPVIGEAIRWTACSFMAESRNGAVMCWG